MDIELTVDPQNKTHILVSYHSWLPFYVRALRQLIAVKKLMLDDTELKVQLNLFTSLSTLAKASLLDNNKAHECSLILLGSVI